MSNFLAISTVTATLVQNLQSAAATAVPGATATSVRPDAPPAGQTSAKVNVFLYQVTPNVAWRNADLPTRRDDGTPVQRPRVAFDLHYLLTFHGNEAQLEPQRILGSVARELHARPQLTRKMIRDAIGSQTFPFLASSNLADEVELVKLTPLPLSLEELSKLWAVFFQTQYSLSVAYQASVVLIESEDTPQPALPVLERFIEVLPFRQPLIAQAISQAGPNQPLVLGSTLLIKGRQLRGDLTQVRLGGQTITPTDASDTLIVLPLASPPLPAGVLRAGVQGVQIVQSLLLGKPPVPHVGFESNVAAFVLRPTIAQVTQDQQAGTLKLTITPSVAKTQRVVLLLKELNPPPNKAPRAYSFNAPSRDKPDAPETTDIIAIPISGVRAGDHLVRVQVDGAESLLDLDSNSPTFGPKTGIL